MAGMRVSGAFPFLGAGDASYFEWAVVHVRFARQPTRGERARIRKGVPAPLRQGVTWEGERQLMVASDQHAHVTIAETYATDPGDAPHPEDADDRFFFATESQVRRFNEDVERWLLEAHAICPVLVAFRAEDAESGGTALSPWHRSSLGRVPAIVAELEAAIAQGDGRLVADMARGIAAMCSELPSEFAERLDPARAIAGALSRGDASELEALLTPPSERRLDALGAALVPESSEHRRAVAGLAPRLLALDESSDALAGLLVQAAAWSAGPARDALTAPTSARRANAFARAAHALATRQIFDGARRMFALIVERSDLEASAWCNALYSLQNADGSPVDPAETERMLAACLPHGGQNPAIFLNAAGAALALHQHDRALALLALAAEHGLDLTPYRELESFRSLAADPRYADLFAKRTRKAARKTAATPKKRPAKR